MKQVYSTSNFSDVELINDSDPIPGGFTNQVPMQTNADGTYTGFYKPTWNGSAWVEGATQEEITAVKTPTAPTPTIEQQQIAQLLLITAQQAQQITTLQQAGGTAIG